MCSFLSLFVTPVAAAAVGGAVADVDVVVVAAAAVRVAVVDVDVVVVAAVI